MGRRLPAGGGRLFVAGLGDSLAVFAYRVSDDSAVPSRSVVAAARMPRQGVSQVFASREGLLWLGERVSVSGSTVFHVFEELLDTWSRTGELTFQENVRILDASQDRVVFRHL